MAVSEDPPSDFGWFSDWVNQRLALFLTFARGLSTEQVLTGLGLRTDCVGLQTFEEADDADQWGPPRIRVGEHGGWAYAVEHFTQRGAESIERLSAAGSEAFALVYTQTICAFNYAAGGRLVSGFDLTVPHIRWGSEPHRFDSYIERAGFLRPGVPDPPAMGARFVQLAFGITIDQDLLERALPSCEITPDRRG
jgi:hypothetical protein